MVSRYIQITAFEGYTLGVTKTRYPWQCVWNLTRASGEQKSLTTTYVSSIREVLSELGVKGLRNFQQKREHTNGRCDLVR